MRAVFLTPLIFLTLFVNAAFATTSFPEKPKSGTVLDEAALINASDLTKINEISVALLKEKQIPIAVVTINSLADFNADAGIEKFATELFNHWQIGYKERNYGALLLVAKNDRKARIEFGADFDHRYDVDAVRIMNELIVPQFKLGDFSGGILAGTQGLDAVIRGLQLPKPEIPTSSIILMVVFAALVVGIAYSLFKSGRTGWGWAFLAAVGMLIWFMLRSAGNGGSGFGGGGSGGGGGATGSW